ncbi:MAG: hypothetical protein OXR73_35840 [Myxococcales bacterium]|nr:hypothetical protein [Myxococcales bacterium]
MRSRRPWLIAGAALLITGGVATLLWWRPPASVQGLAHSRMTDVLEQRLAMPITVGAVAVRDGAVIAKAISARDRQSGLSLEASEIRAKLAPERPGGAVDALQTVEVDGLRLTVRLDANGLPILPAGAESQKGPLDIQHLTATAAELTLVTASNLRLSIPAADIRYTRPSGSPPVVALKAAAGRVTPAEKGGPGVHPVTTDLALQDLSAQFEPSGRAVDLSGQLTGWLTGQAAAPHKTGGEPIFIRLHSEGNGEHALEARFQDISLATLTAAGLPGGAQAGSVSGTATLRGTLEPLRLAGSLTATATAAPTRPGPTADAVAEPAQATATYRGDLTIGDDKAHLAGELTMGDSLWQLTSERSQQSGQEPSTTVTATLRKGQVAPLAALLGHQASGQGRLEWRVEQGPTGVSRTLSFALRNASAWGARAETATGELRWAPQQGPHVALDAKNLVLSHLPGLRFARGLLKTAPTPTGPGSGHDRRGHDDEGQGKVEIERLALSLSEASDQGVIEGRGSLWPVGRLDVTWSGKGLPVANLAGLLPGLDGSGGKLDAKGTLRGTLAAPRVTADVQFPQIDVSNYLQRAFGARQISGHVKGRARITGNPVSGSLTGSIHVATLAIAQDHVHIGNAAPIEIDLSGDGMTLRPAQLKGPHTRLTMRGKAGGRSGLSLSLVGETDLALLAERYPDLTRAEGTLRSEMRVTGDPAKPKISGQVRLDDGTAVLFGRKLSDVKADLALSGDTLTIKRARAHWQAGEVQATGELRLAGLSLQDFELGIVGLDQHLEPTRGMKLTVDANLSLRSRAKHQLPVLGGRITLRKGGYNHPLRLSGLSVLAQKGFGGRKPGSRPRPPRFALAIGVDQQEPLVLRNNIFDARLKTARRKGLRLGGTDEAPELKGRLRLAGRLMVHSTDFSIARANIDFDGASGLLPQVNVAAATRRGLTLQLRGTADAFEIAMGCRTRREDVLRGDPGDFHCRSNDGKLACGSLDELLNRLVCARR